MGLKYVNNDACYPSLMVVGQIMNAVLSGKYDLSKTAIIITQTGGGCPCIKLYRFHQTSTFKSWIILYSCNITQCTGA